MWWFVGGCVLRERAGPDSFHHSRLTARHCAGSCDIIAATIHTYRGVEQWLAVLVFAASHCDEVETFIQHESNQQALIEEIVHNVPVAAGGRAVLGGRQ